MVRKKKPAKLTGSTFAALVKECQQLASDLLALETSEAKVKDQKQKTEHRLNAIHSQLPRATLDKDKPNVFDLGNGEVLVCYVGTECPLCTRGGHYWIDEIVKLRTL